MVCVKEAGVMQQGDIDQIRRGCVVSIPWFFTCDLKDLNAEHVIDVLV